MKHLLLECEHCGATHLVNLTNQTYELIDDNFDAPEGTEDDKVMTVNEMLEQADDDEDEQPSKSTDPDYRCNTNTQESYKHGTPMVPGRKSEDGLRIENKPVTRFSSGIKVETAMSTTPPPGVRQKRSKLNMQPPGKATPFAPKRKKPSELTDADHSREDFESYGDDATQDFVGLGGQEGHFDALLQQAYEADLSNRGF